MKTSNILIGLVLVAGAFLLVPRSDSVKTTTDTTNSEIATATIVKKGDVMNFEKISATSATIETDKGTIELVLYPQDAPKTVTNFATLAKNGYYDNLTFHRVVDGFVIQGGDPTGSGSGGESVYGEKFEDELNPETASYKEGYKEGVLAMANAGPNTNGSQFFIMLADNPLPNDYTIFGKVTAGMDVVKKIVMGDGIKTITVK